LLGRTGAAVARTNWSSGCSEELSGGCSEELSGGCSEELSGGCSEERSGGCSEELSGGYSEELNGGCSEEQNGGCQEKLLRLLGEIEGCDCPEKHLTAARRVKELRLKESRFSQ
jgi:hypothetical protein